MLFRTITGREIDLVAFRGSDIDLTDIAFALSNICRYNGHVKRIYTVAEHSMNLANMVDPRYEAHALLHDAAEAYLGDLAAPVKNLLPEYQSIEDRFQRIIFRRFGLGERLPSEVRVKDIAIRQAEMAVLMNFENGSSLEKKDNDLKNMVKRITLYEKAYEPFIHRLKGVLNAQY